MTTVQGPGSERVWGWCPESGVPEPVTSIRSRFGAFGAVPALCVGGILLGRSWERFTIAPLISLALIVPALWLLLFVAFASRAAADHGPWRPRRTGLGIGLAWQEISRLRTRCGVSLPG